jgi:hypothetical protein
MIKQKLINTLTGEEIKPGALLRTFRGEEVTLVAIHEPKHPGSSGKVTCRDANGTQHLWNVFVIGAFFVEVKE